MNFCRIARAHERRGQQAQNKADKRDHRANLADSSLNKPGWGFRYTQLLSLASWDADDEPG